MNEPDARADYLAELVGLLWPEHGRLARAGLRPGRSVTEAYHVVPSADRPRLLVPAGSARAAASAVLHAVEPTGGRDRFRRRALAAAFRLGVRGATVGALFFRDRVKVTAAAVRGPGEETAEAEQSLVDLLGGVLGQPVHLAVHLGPARANRKPVVVVLAADGTVLAYAKLGINPLTRSLVVAEGEALAKLNTVSLDRIKVADVLHRGRWNGHDLLVQRALPVWQPRAEPEAAAEGQLGAMLAVAGAFGIRRGRLAGSGYAARLTAATAQVADRTGEARSAAAERLADALRTLLERDPVLPFGCWHGDWNSGNTAVLDDGRVLVWDWERFDPDVPIGFDALHRSLQVGITRQGITPVEAARQLIGDSVELLAPFGVTPTETSFVTALYLIELGTRYLQDRQAEAGARVGRVDEWLLPALGSLPALHAIPTGGRNGAPTARKGN